MAFLTTVSRILHSSPESLSEENLEFCKKGNVPKLRIACEQFSDKEKLVTLPRSIAQQWFRLFQEKAALLSMENLTNAVCHYCYPIESHDLVKWITVTCEDGKQISLPLIRLLPYERFRKVIDLTKLDQPHMFPQYSLFNFDVFGQYLKTPHSLSADVSTLERAVKLYDLADWIDDRKLKDLCIEQMKYLHDKEDCPETVKYLYKATREKMDAEDAVSAGKLTKAETHLSNA